MKALGGGFLLMLLMGVGLMLYLSAKNAQTVVSKAAPAREVAEEVAGVGMRESFKLEVLESGGKTTGLKIVALDMAGPLAKMYGVQLGDIVMEVGPFSVRDTDVEMLQAQMWELGGRQRKLTVLRNGEKLELDNHGATAKMGKKLGQ